LGGSGLPGYALRVRVITQRSGSSAPSCRRQSGVLGQIHRCSGDFYMLFIQQF